MQGTCSTSRARFATTRAIRNQSRADQRQPWIVALTARGRAGDRELCLDAGMDDYLLKPLILEDLGAVLARARKSHTG